MHFIIALTILPLITCNILKTFDPNSTISEYYRFRNVIEGCIKKILCSVQEEHHYIIVCPKYFKHIVRLEDFQRPMYIFSEQGNIDTKFEISTRDVNIIFSDNIHVIQEISWDMNSNFIVMADSTDDLKQIFNIFWSLKNVNVIALVPYTKKTVGIFTYYPYHENSCGVDIKIKRIMTWKRGETVKNMFVDKIGNMHGCNLSVTVLNRPPYVITELDEYSGIEVEIVKALAKSINASPVFTYLYKRQWMQEHNNLINYLDNALSEDLVHKTGDIAIGMLMLTRSVSEIVDGVHYYDSLCVTLAVPKFWPLPAPAAFLNSTALLTIGCAPIVILILYCGFRKEKRKFMKSLRMATYPLLGFQISAPKVTSQRIILVFWLTCCMFYLKYSETLFSSRLIVPLAGEQLDDIEDVIENHIPFAGEVFLIKEVLPRYNIDSSLILKNPSTTNSLGALKFIAESKNLTFLGTVENMKYTLSRNPEFQEKVYLQKTCIATYSPIIETRKNSPFLNFLQKKLSTLGEIGIIRGLISLETQKTHRMFEKQKKSASQSFTVNDVFWPMIVLLSGCTMSFCVLICEIVFIRFRTRN